MTKLLIKLRYLLEGSGQSNNLCQGLSPLEAKYEKTLVEQDTGEVIITTDLKERLNKRNKNLSLFHDKYVGPCFKDKTVSILCVIISEHQYPQISQWTSNFKKYLKRRGIDFLGFVWQRDIGENVFEKHFHLLIAVSYIKEEYISDIIQMGKSSPDKFVYEILKTEHGMKRYLKKKELYASRYKKAWAKSENFKSPSKSQ